MVEYQDFSYRKRFRILEHSSIILDMILKLK